MKVESKHFDALLLVSFGVSMPEVKKNSIDALERKMSAAFKDLHIVSAFTSEMIRAKLQRLQEPCPPNPDLALQDLQALGYRRVLIVSSHILPAYEYEKMCRQIELHKRYFDELCIAEPLLYRPKDYKELVAALQEIYPLLDDELLVLMGHGSEHPMNAAYAALQYEASLALPQQMLIGTVEGYPELDDIIEQLDLITQSRARKPKIILAPLLLVAGEHARNDMASDEPDSWKSRLEALGYEVELRLRGLGESSAIQDLYVEHALRACGQKEDELNE